MTRLEQLHPAKANMQSYDDDWGVVFKQVRHIHIPTNLKILVAGAASETSDISLHNLFHSHSLDEWGIEGSKCELVQIKSTC